jgi:hypothetical protein
VTGSNHDIGCNYCPGIRHKRRKLFLISQNWHRSREALPDGARRRSLEFGRDWLCLREMIDSVLLTAHTLLIEASMDNTMAILNSKKRNGVDSKQSTILPNTCVYSYRPLKTKQLPAFKIGSDWASIGNRLTVGVLTPSATEGL